MQPSLAAPSTGTISGITVSAGGTGYTSAPTVTISSPATGVTATATATVTGGVVTAVTITNAGVGYNPSTAATVTFTGGGGSGATATASIATGIGQIFGGWPLAIDSVGSIYFGDYGGNRVRLLGALSTTTYPLLLPLTSVGTLSGIQGFEVTNIGTPGSTLTVTADNASTNFGFLSPSGVPGIAECATTSTTTPLSSTISKAVNLSAGQSCSFGMVGTPMTGGASNPGTAIITDNSLNASANQTMYVSVLGGGVSTIITSATTTIVANQPATFLATLTTNGGAPVTCGNVNFYINGGSTAYPQALNSSGVATFTTSSATSPTTTISRSMPVRRRAVPAPTQTSRPAARAQTSRFRKPS